MDKPETLLLVDVPLALRDDLWHTQAEHVLLKLQANNNQLIAQRDALLEALKEIAADYADRFDLDSPSTNPGIKFTIKQARAAIKAVEETK